VCWDPGAGCLYAGGENGQLYRVDLAAGAAQTGVRGVPLHRPAHWGADADPATGTGGIGAGA
jgi:hypothetical protein